MGSIAQLGIKKNIKKYIKKIFYAFSIILLFIILLYYLILKSSVFSNGVSLNESLILKQAPYLNKTETGSIIESEDCQNNIKQNTT